MMNLDEAIHARRSNRNFEECTISMQEIQQILEAGLLAPSAKNRQPWFFHIIYNEASRRSFLEVMHGGIDELERSYHSQNIVRPDIESAKFTARSMEKAADIIVVTCKKKYINFYEDDVQWSLRARDIEVTDILSIGAAVQNTLLKATEMGYETLWVCDIFYAYPQIAKFLQTEDPIVSAVCIGKSNQTIQMPHRLSLKEVSTII